LDGRIYDPVIGRFLSADPFVQDPGNSQCLNRYSYCINNPLAFTDPTGFGFFGSLWRSIKNSSIVRVAIGVAVAVAIGVAVCFCPPVGLSLWQIAMAAAIGGATTTGLGLASGVGWKQALFEGGAAFAISGGILYAGGTIAGGGSLSLSASGGSGSGISIGIGIPLEMPGDEMRAPQGHDFVDPASHKLSEDASPSGRSDYYQNTMPIFMSDRAPGSNYGNGAGTDAYKEIFNLSHESERHKHTVLESLCYCTEKEIKDTIFDISAATSVLFSIPKKLAKSAHLLKRGTGLTTPLSIAEHWLSKSSKIEPLLDTISTLFRQLTNTKGILRGTGRIISKGAVAFTAIYTVGSMGYCIYKDQNGD
jgi:hypothetical protein